MSARIIASTPRKPSPLESELDRLLDLRMRRMITAEQYQTDRDAVLLRMKGFD